MRKKISIISTLLTATVTLVACSSGGSSNSSPNGFDYPATETVNASNSYFGTVVADPYQWLESTTAPNVLTWVDEQNRFTQNYFDQIPYYQQVVEQVDKIFTEDSTTVLKNFSLQRNKTFVTGKNGLLFYQLNKVVDNNSNRPGKGLQTVSRDNIIYVTDAKNHAGRVFLDINKLYPGDVITVKNIATFDDGRYLVYSLIRNYGDLADLHVIDITNTKEIAVIANTFPDVNVWSSGFFYVKPQYVTNPLLSPYNYDQLTYFYVGQNDKAENQLVYQGGANITVGVDYLYSEESTLYFSTAVDTTNNLYKVDLSQNTWTPQIFIDDGYQHSFSVQSIESTTQTAVVATNSGAKRLRLINVNLSNPESSNWQNILPAVGSNKIIDKIFSCGGKYITQNIDHGLSKMEVYSATGVLESQIKLPGLGAVEIATSACQSESQFNFMYSNLVTPYQYIQYDPQDNTESVYSTASVPTFDPTQYEMSKIDVPSTGGATVTVFLAHKKGMVFDSTTTHPAYIYVYGGFDSPVMPSFDKRAVYFLEQGGVYALAQVRGGGEQGTSWYNDGRLLNKQNTYDDTIAVAEYLIAHNYTTASKLGLGGRSNGGLTTAAVALQRPDLFQVAFPAVGVLDLLRYNLFTYGFSWYSDYGFSSIQEEFNNMYKFSPLQNIHAQSYPAMYIQTGQQDSRVPPLHSYKFAATMQNVAKGPNPYLLDSYPNLSHFPENMAATEAAKTWAFFFYNTHTQPSQ